ncbi:MAG TPA: hypothetical protein VF997_18750 [Polyangia bacterium]
MKRALVLGLVAAAAASSTACDPLATGSFRPPFITINGVIDGSTAAATPDRVRVALMWQNDQTPGQNYADQLVDVLAQFPAAFSVDVRLRPKAAVIDSLPPAQPIGFGVDPAMRWSVGTLVVYADDNRNGQLDVVGPGATSSDRVLAAATGFDVWSLASGKPAPAAFVGIFPVAPGFSLVAEPPPHEPAPGECGHFSPEGHFTDLCPVATAEPQPLDATTFVEHLTLVDDARLQGYACNAFWGPIDYPDWLQAGAGDVCDGGACPFCRGYQCPLDLPQPGDPVQCSSDKLSYVYKRCVDDAALCGTRFCHWGHGERLATDPAPPGWPCL